MACAKSLSIGRENLLHQLHGRTSSASATATPHFQLEDELLVEERDVMWGRVYQQRGSKKGANEADTASTDGAERWERPSPAAEGAGGLQRLAPFSG